MRDFFSKAVFFRLSVALIIGILCFEVLKLPSVLFVVLLVLGIGLMLFFASIKTIKSRYKFDFIFGIGFLLMIVCFGYYFTSQNAENLKFNHNDQKGIYKVVLTDFPSEKARSVLVYARAKSFSDSVRTENLDVKVVLYLQKDSNALNLETGDKLLISTILSTPKKKNNPNEFDYGRYLLRKGVVASGYVASGDWQKIGRDNSFSLIRTAQKCRLYLLNIYRNMNIPDDEFSIAASLTLGYKDALSPELRESFSATGAAHILAVSGMHVGIIFIVLNFTLSFLNKTEKTRRYKSLIIIILLCFYAFITGLPPSACRAVFMFSLMSFGSVISRKTYTYNSVFCSAFILLIINPMWLFDVGFQFSYSAVLAIIYFEPKISNLLTIKNKPLKYLWQLTSVSIAAQLGVAPFALFYFHQFPHYFLLANFIVIPAASLIIYSAFFLFAVSKIPILNIVAAFILEWVIKIMIYGVKFVETLPNSLTITWLSNAELFLFYMIIITIGFLFYKIKVKYLVAIAVFSILFIISILTHNVDNQKLNQLTIFNDNKNFTLNIIDKNQNFVYASDFEYAEKIAENFWINRSCKNPIFEEIDTTEFVKIIQFNQQNFVILTDRKIFRKLPEEPLEVDYLVVNKNIYPSNDIFEKYFSPKTLITTGDVYENNNKKFAVLAEENGIDFYPIREKGAFILRE